MQILHLSSTKSWRGGEQQIAYLMLELRKKGITQWLLCVEGSQMEAFCKKEGFEHFSYRKVFSWNPLVALKIRRLCKHLGATHIHAHDAHAHTFALLSAVLFGNKTPVIVSRRVDFPVGDSFVSRWKYNHPAVRKIVCVSHFIRKIMLPAIDVPSKLVVVHSGVTTFTKVSNFRKRGLRQEFQVPENEFLIANIAAIAPHKDYFTFVRTAEILVREGFPAKFLIIGGDGGEEENIRLFIREKGLENHIILTGFRNDIADIFPEIDMLLFTSKSEGLGTTILDAFLNQVPVVATAAGGIPEMIEHEKTGILASVGDAGMLAVFVKRMLEDSDLQKRLVRNALEKAGEFSTEKMAEGMIAVYQSRI